MAYLVEDVPVLLAYKTVVIEDFPFYTTYKAVVIEDVQAVLLEMAPLPDYGQLYPRTV